MRSTRIPDSLDIFAVQRIALQMAEVPSDLTDETSDGPFLPSHAIVYDLLIWVDTISADCGMFPQTIEDRGCSRQIIMHPSSESRHSSLLP